VLVWLMLQPLDAPTSGTDWTQIGITMVVTFGVCFTAVMSYLGVRAGRAAKEAAARTQEYNTQDHGRVVAALQALTDKVDHLGGRIHDVGQNVGTLRDQFVGHLQHHLDKETKEL
jgi:hypothetical protein